MVLIKENGSDMFWGIRLDDGKKYSQTVEAAFHISMAAIDSSTKNTEPTTVMISHSDVEYVLCTLQKGNAYQQSVDLNFAEGESLTLFTKGKGPVFMTGYRVFDVEGEEEDDIDEEALRRYRQTHAHDGLEEFMDEEDSADSTDDEEDDSSEMNEEDVKVTPITATSKKRKINAAGDAPASKRPQIPVEVEDDSDSDEDDEDFEGSEDFEDDDEEDEEEDDSEDDEEEDSEEDEEEDDSADEDEMQKLIADLEKAKPKKDSTSKPPPQVNGGKTPEKKSGSPAKTPKHEQKTPKQDNKTSKQEQKTPKSEAKPNVKSESSHKSDKKSKSKTPEPSKKVQTPNKKGGQTPKTNGQAAAKVATPKPTNLAGGLTSVDKVEGHGPVAKSGRMVHVYYIGKLQNGKQFDATTKGPPFKFRLGKQEVIKGWDMGVEGMKVGGKRTLTIPPSMAYGNQSIPGIPRNSTLVFDVELRSVS